MLNLFSLLGAGVNSAAESIVGSTYETFITIANLVLPVVAGIVLTLGIILAVKVGVEFAQAEDDEGKKKAKGRLVNIAIGFISALVIIGVLAAVMNSGIVKDLFKTSDARG